MPIKNQKSWTEIGSVLAPARCPPPIQLVLIGSCSLPCIYCLLDVSKSYLSFDSCFFCAGVLYFLFWCCLDDLSLRILFSSLLRLGCWRILEERDFPTTCFFAVLHSIMCKCCLSGSCYVYLIFSIFHVFCVEWSFVIGGFYRFIHIQRSPLIFAVDGFDPHDQHQPFQRPPRPPSIFLTTPMTNIHFFNDPHDQHPSF